MTVISDSIRSVAGVPDDRPITFTSGELRDSSGSDAIVSTMLTQLTPVDGEFTVELDPGPAKVTLRAGESYLFVVPDSAEPVRLWPLIEAYIPQPPMVVDAAVAARDAAMGYRDDAQAILDDVAAGAVPDAAVAVHVESATSATRAALDEIYVTPATVDSLVTEIGDATYTPSFPESTSIVTDPATGNVTSVTVNGVTTTYTYGPNGVATDTRLGVTRAYTYDGDGNLTLIEEI